MASEVSICNQALSWLGVSAIMSLDDPQKQAQLCKTNYAQLRNTVLEEGKWTFATRRVVYSTPVATGPAYGYSNKFALASDQLVVIEANDSGEPQGDYTLDWRVEERHIVTNASKIYAKVIMQVTDVSKFTNTFRQALAARIGAELALPLTESHKKMMDMWALYDAKLTNAMTIDGMQGRSDRIKSRSNIMRRR
jgi:hypothetical protein